MANSKIKYGDIYDDIRKLLNANDVDYDSINFGMQKQSIDHLPELPTKVSIYMGNNEGYYVGAGNQQEEFFFIRTHSDLDNAIKISNLVTKMYLLDNW